ncbi:MAG: hypothetical protein ACFFBP_18150 [Promethearchaeota archaeon]
MNPYEDLDVKLRTLIHLSKKNEDSRRAAVVFYLLIRRVLNESGVKLGFAPLISNKEHKAFEYMNIINSVMQNTFNFKIFHKEIIDKVQKYELLYLRNPMSFPFDSLKELVNIYYDLRKMDVPNVYQSIHDTDYLESSYTTQANNFFIRSNNGRSGIFFKKKDSNHVKQYLSHELSHKEAMIRKKLKNKYDKESFEQLLQYKKLKREIAMGNSKKISFKGQLKNNHLYQESLNEIPGFFLIGLAVVFIMLSIVILIQELFRPEISGAFTLIAFALFGIAIILGFLYWKLYYQEVRNQ